MDSAEQYIGAIQSEELVGALSVCHDEEVHGVNISSLVVSPAHQRRGVGLALLRATAERHAGIELTVQTAVANAPALGLYALFNFKEHRRWFTGGGSLELVKLSRTRSHV